MREGGSDNGTGWADGDGNLDLLVVSDFAGLDLYRNDGRGHFTDVTSQWVADSRAFGMSHALADFNADGRVDLVVTTFEVWPEEKQTLRLYRNTLRGGGNWIGFKFREEAGRASPVGVQVALRANGHRAVRHLVTGDSFRSQHPNTVHFGLGEADRVDRVEVRWTTGQVVTVREPAVNCHHFVRPPPRGSVGN